LTRGASGAQPGSGAPATLVGVVHATVLCALTASLLSAAAWQVGRFSREVAQLCRAPLPERQWRYIVVHHSATSGGGAASIGRYHTRERGWDSLGYHFVIGNGTQTGDGEIEAGPRWTAQQTGSHAGVLEYNKWGIGVCLVGHFSERDPTELQMRSLRALARRLMDRYAIPPQNVLGHRECPGAATECPGDRFPIAKLRESLR